MSIISIILIILGLSLFEIVSSIDNAIINAEVLSTMGQKFRRFFLTWGIIIAVFLVRGLLPFFIVWITIPSLGPLGALTSTFSNDPSITETVKQSAGFPLALGGTFLLFLFFSWLFLETKNYGLKGERFFHAQGVWFYTVTSILLAVLVYFALLHNQFVALGIIFGSTIFFITHGFRQYAQKQELELTGGAKSDLSKLLYLEIIDASFSIDGVLGAFAFTFSVPLIFIGNGIGAIVLRKITVSNIERIKKYKYLKNGAMYSILFLGVVMVLESFGFEIPKEITPILTVLIVGYFFMKSRKEVAIN